MIIALASPRVATSLDEGLATIDRLMDEAVARGARIVCFPEAYLPGLRGVDLDVLPFTPADLARVLAEVGQSAKRHQIAAILGTERPTFAGRENIAVLFGSDGGILGEQ